jgi:hypothetical protein
MMRLAMLTVLGACGGGGQSPSSEHIALGQVTCTRDDTMFSFATSATVTLEVGQAFTVTFLTDVDSGLFERSIAWECDEHTPVGNRGCERAAIDPEQAQTSVVEIDRLVQGSVPTSFEFTTVASITDMPMGTELENVLVQDSCP